MKDVLKARGKEPSCGTCELQRTQLIGDDWCVFSFRCHTISYYPMVISNSQSAQGKLPEGA